MDKRANNGPKGVWVGSDIDALAFFAKRLHGEDSDAAVFATSQPKERKNRIELTGAQTLQLTELTTPSRLRELRALPVVLMSYAESETHFSPSKRVAARLRSANLAAAISIQLDLLLHPAELVSLVCEAGKADLVITSSNGSERSACLMTSFALSGKEGVLPTRCNSPAAGGDGSWKCWPSWAELEWDRPSLFLVA